MIIFFAMQKLISLKKFHLLIVVLSPYAKGVLF